jgi:hypothetical protein
MLELTLWSINGSPVAIQHKISLKTNSIRAVRDVSAYGHPMKSEVTTDTLDMRFSENERQVSNFNTVYEVLERYPDIIEQLTEEGWK